MKRPIVPEESLSAGFAILLIIITQITALVYFSLLGSVEVETGRFGAETETVVNTSSVFAAISISLFGWLFGLVLVALSKARQELCCIRQLLNEEYGRTSFKEPKTSSEVPRKSESRVVAWKE